MNPTSKDIATLLSDQSSLGLTVGTDLFFSRMPDNPDDCVAIVDGPGNTPMLAQAKLANNYYYSAITIYARNTDYTLGWQALNQIIEFLHGHSNEVIDGTYYALIKALSDPQVLEYDANERIVLMVNFEVQRRNN